MRWIIITLLLILSSFAQEAAHPAIPDTPPSPALPLEHLKTVQLQIFLDQHHFGPGIIDGKRGIYTKMATEAYNLSKKRGEQLWGSVEEEAHASIKTVFATAIVPEIAAELVDATFLHSSDRSYQATRHDMPYRSIAEFMAERYHTSVDFLQQLNGKELIQNLRIRSALLVPNIAPFQVERLAQGRTFHKDPTLSQHWAIVDTDKHQIRIYQPHPNTSVPAKETTDKETPTKASPSETQKEAPLLLKQHLDTTQATLLAAYPITPGKPEFIRRGTWKIINSIELPTWRFDASLLQTGERSTQGLTIPSGPNNPVGVLWIGLSRKGIGIHGTDDPDKIGRGRSAGCIRLSNWDIVKLPQFIRPGSTVIIR